MPETRPQLIARLEQELVDVRAAKARALGAQRYSSGEAGVTVDRVAYNTLVSREQVLEQRLARLARGGRPRIGFGIPVR